MFALLILPMMQLGAHYKMTLVYVNTDTTVIVAHLVTVNKDNLRKLSTSMFLQNTVHGQLTLKQVFQAVQSRWIHLLLQKKQAIKTCEQGGRNAPCVIGVSVRNGCIAVAQGQSGKKVKTFYGTEPSIGQAEPTALRKCQAAGAVQCRITTPEGCSLPKF